MSGVTVITGGTVLAPTPIGTADLTIAWGRIAEIGPTSSYRETREAVVFDASGRYVVPAFVDAHLHIQGSGAAGEASTPPLPSSEIFLSGSTTVVGCLGADDISLGLGGLLIHAKRLETEGVSAFIYTGGFPQPPPTLLGTVRKDIALFDRVLGVKSTIGERLGGMQSENEVVRLCGEVSLGGRLGGKHAIVHLHLGDDVVGVRSLTDLVRRGLVDPEIVVATHANRSPDVLDGAIGYATAGGYIDLTATLSPDSGRPHALAPRYALDRVIKSGIDPHRVSLSSDAGGPRVSADGDDKRLWQTLPTALLNEWQEIVRTRVLDLETALWLVTRAPADRLGLQNKGRLEVGADGDVLVLSQALEPVQIWAKGRPKIEAREAVTR